MSYTNQRAFDKLTSAKFQMVRKFPFFAHIVLSIEMVEVPNLFSKTMATDMVNIYYHPEFVINCTMSELIGTLAHEACHIAFLHGTRRQNRDPEIWNFACVAEGSLITLSDGSLMAIEDMRSGTALAAIMSSSEVFMVTKSIKNVLVEIVMDNGYKLLCSEDHRVLTNDGFIEASKITEGASCIVDTRFATANHHDGSDIYNPGNHGGDGDDVPASGQLSVSQRAEFQEDVARGQETIRHFIPEPRGNRVLGRNYGRGRDDFYRSIESEGEDVLQAARHDIDNQLVAGGMVGEETVQRRSGKELEWESILAVYGIRIEDSTVIDGHAALLGDQETARNLLSSLHGTAEFWDQVNSGFARDADAVSASENLEYSRVHTIRRHEGRYVMYDLATTSHVFIANGIVTHNCDYAINPMVLDAGCALPGFGLYEDRFRNMTAQAIYAELMKNQKKIDELLSKLPKMMVPGQGDGQGNANGDDQGDGQGMGDMIHGGVIDLKDFKDEQGNQISASEVEHNIMMKVAAAANMAKSIGKMPVGFDGLITAMGKPTINWHDYIHLWVKGTKPDDYTWARPNRRMLANHRVYMPQLELRGAGTGLLSIDTSGSVSDAELVKYVTEIVGVIEATKPDKLIIVQHDAHIHSVTEWSGNDDFSSLKITGRGGTCIAPSFKYAKELEEPIDWMICFSDMEINDFPSEAPTFPVLWAATGRNTAPFGQYIPLKDAMDG